MIGREYDVQFDIKSRRGKEVTEPKLKNWNRSVLVGRRLTMVNYSLVLPGNAQSIFPFFLGSQSTRQVAYLRHTALQFSLLLLMSNCISQNSLQFNFLKHQEKAGGTSFIPDYLCGFLPSQSKKTKPKQQLFHFSKYRKTDLLLFLRYLFNQKCLEIGVTWML